jgi:hypothetical protein
MAILRPAMMAQAPGFSRLFALFVALVAGAAAWAACGGGTAATRIGPAPPPETRATLSGPLCMASACRCRTSDADAGDPNSTFIKRYEVRIGPMPDALWVTVGDNILYKSAERSTECFYLDLRPGEHPVTIRGEGEYGVGARVTISEQNAAGPWWYDTFRFQCGAPGNCDFARLDEWKRSLAKYERSAHDPCGSTRILGLRWETGKAADMRHPEKLEVSLVLDVRDFTPEHPPGHAACADRF